MVMVCAMRALVLLESVQIALGVPGLSGAVQQKKSEAAPSFVQPVQPAEEETVCVKRSQLPADFSTAWHRDPQANGRARWFARAIRKHLYNHSPFTFEERVKLGVTRKFNKLGVKDLRRLEGMSIPFDVHDFMRRLEGKTGGEAAADRRLEGTTVAPTRTTTRTTTGTATATSANNSSGNSTPNSTPGNTTLAPTPTPLTPGEQLSCASPQSADTCTANQFMQVMLEFKDAMGTGDKLRECLYTGWSTIGSCWAGFCMKGRNWCAELAGGWLRAFSMSRLILHNPQDLQCNAGGPCKVTVSGEVDLHIPKLTVKFGRAYVRLEWNGIKSPTWSLQVTGSVNPFKLRAYWTIELSGTTATMKSFRLDCITGISISVGRPSIGMSWPFSMAKGAAEPLMQTFMHHTINAMFSGCKPKQFMEKGANLMITEMFKNAHVIKMIKAVYTSQLAASGPDYTAVAGPDTDDRPGFYTGQLSYSSASSVGDKHSHVVLMWATYYPDCTYSMAGEVQELSRDTPNVALEGKKMPLGTTHVLAKPANTLSPNHLIWPKDAHWGAVTDSAVIAGPALPSLGLDCVMNLFKDTALEGMGYDSSLDRVEQTMPNVSPIQFYEIPGGCTPEMNLPKTVYAVGLGSMTFNLAGNAEVQCPNFGTCTITAAATMATDVGAVNMGFNDGVFSCGSTFSKSFSGQFRLGQTQAVFDLNVVYEGMDPQTVSISTSRSRFGLLGILDFTMETGGGDSQCSAADLVESVMEEFGGGGAMSMETYMEDVLTGNIPQMENQLKTDPIANSAFLSVLDLSIKDPPTVTVVSFTDEDGRPDYIAGTVTLQSVGGSGTDYSMMGVWILNPSSGQALGQPHIFDARDNLNIIVPHGTRLLPGQTHLGAAVVSDYDRLKTSLPASGLFQFTDWDCQTAGNCPPGGGLGNSCMDTAVNFFTDTFKEGAFGGGEEVDVPIPGGGDTQNLASLVKNICPLTVTLPTSFKVIGTDSFVVEYDAPKPTPVCANGKCEFTMQTSWSAHFGPMSLKVEGLQMSCGAMLPDATFSFTASVGRSTATVNVGFDFEDRMYKAVSMSVDMTQLGDIHVPDLAFNVQGADELNECASSETVKRAWQKVIMMQFQEGGAIDIRKELTDRFNTMTDSLDTELLKTKSKESMSPMLLATIGVAPLVAPAVKVKSFVDTNSRTDFLGGTISVKVNGNIPTSASHFSVYTVDPTTTLAPGYPKQKIAIASYSETEVELVVDKVAMKGATHLAVALTNAFTEHKDNMFPNDGNLLTIVDLGEKLSFSDGSATGEGAIRNAEVSAKILMDAIQGEVQKLFPSTNDLYKFDTGVGGSQNLPLRFPQCQLVAVLPDKVDVIGLSTMKLGFSLPSVEGPVCPNGGGGDHSCVTTVEAIFDVSFDSLKMVTGDVKIQCGDKVDIKFNMETTLGPSQFGLAVAMTFKDKTLDTLTLTPGVTRMTTPQIKFNGDLGPLNCLMTSVMSQMTSTMDLSNVMENSVVKALIDPMEKMMKNYFQDHLHNVIFPMLKLQADDVEFQVDSFEDRDERKQFVHAVVELGPIAGRRLDTGHLMLPATSSGVAVWFVGKDVKSIQPFHTEPKDANGMAPATIECPEDVYVPKGYTKVAVTGHNTVQVSTPPSFDDGSSFTFEERDEEHRSFRNAVGYSGFSAIVASIVVSVILALSCCFARIREGARAKKKELQEIETVSFMEDTKDVKARNPDRCAGVHLGFHWFCFFVFVQGIALGVLFDIMHTEYAQAFGKERKDTTVTLTTKGFQINRDEDTGATKMAMTTVMHSEFQNTFPFGLRINEFSLDFALTKSVGNESVEGFSGSAALAHEMMIPPNAVGHTIIIAESETDIGDSMNVAYDFMLKNAELMLWGHGYIKGFYLDFTAVGYTMTVRLPPQQISCNFKISKKHPGFVDLSANPCKFQQIPFNEKDDPPSGGRRLTTMNLGPNEQDPTMMLTLVRFLSNVAYCVGGAGVFLAVAAFCYMRYTAKSMYAARFWAAVDRAKTLRLAKEAARKLLPGKPKGPPAILHYLTVEMLPVVVMYFGALALLKKAMWMCLAYHRVTDIGPSPFEGARDDMYAYPNRWNVVGASLSTGETAGPQADTFQSVLDCMDVGIGELIWGPLASTALTDWDNYIFPCITKEQSQGKPWWGFNVPNLTHIIYVLTFGVNVIAHVVFVGLLIFLVYQYCSKISLRTRMGSGKYFRFLWRLQANGKLTLFIKMAKYLMSSAILMLFTFVASLSVYHFEKLPPAQKAQYGGTRFTVVMEIVVPFCRTLFWEVLAVFAAMERIRSPNSLKPRFNYDCDDFEKIRFHWTWDIGKKFNSKGEVVLTEFQHAKHCAGLLCSNHEQFCDGLKQALIDAHQGKMEPLELLLEEPRDAVAVMEICEANIKAHAHTMSRDMGASAQDEVPFERAGCLGSLVTLIHLVTVELLPLYLWFLAMNELLAGSIGYLTTNIERMSDYRGTYFTEMQDGVRRYKQPHDISMSLMAVEECIQEASSKLLWGAAATNHPCLTDGTLFQGLDSHVNIPKAAWMVMPLLFNYLMFFLVILILLIVVKNFFAQGIFGSQVGSGRYLAFTIELEKNRRYRAVCAVIFILTPLPLLTGLFVMFTGYGFEGLFDFLEGHVFEYFAVIVTVFKLASFSPPKFNHDTETFNNIKFNRGRLTCSAKEEAGGGVVLTRFQHIKYQFWSFFTHNDEFCDELTCALWFARASDRDQLAKMMHRPEQMNSFLGCSLFPDTNEDNDKEDNEAANESNAISASVVPSAPSKPTQKAAPEMLGEPVPEEVKEKQKELAEVLEKKDEAVEQQKFELAAALKKREDKIRAEIAAILAGGTSDGSEVSEVIELKEYDVSEKTAPPKEEAAIGKDEVAIKVTAGEDGGDAVDAAGDRARTNEDEKSVTTEPDKWMEL